MGWRRDAHRAIRPRDWRSTTSSRIRTSHAHPPRLRNVWMTRHSARKLRRVRWSAKRLRRRCSWCRTHKGTNWRLLPSQWSLQPHRLSPNRLFYPLQDMTYTSRKPAKPRIWGWCVQRKKANATYHGQEMGQGGKTNEKVCEVRKVDFEASHCAALENGGLGAESLWNCGDGVRRHRGSSKRGPERRKPHNAEVEAGV